MEIERRIIEPIAGFAPEIGIYLNGFRFARKQTRQLIEDLTTAEIARRVTPQMNSIGAIAMHLGECEYWYLQSVAAEKEMTEEGKKLSHWCDTFENDCDRGYTAQYLLETLDKITKLTEKFLSDKTDSDLDKMHPRRDLDRPVELSLRWILQLSIDHEAHHRGQIALIKNLLRANHQAG